MELVGPLGVEAPLLDRAQVSGLHLCDHEHTLVDRPHAVGQLDEYVRLASRR